MNKENEPDPDEVRQTEMEELNPEWYTSGCIIHEGKAHLVTAHIALLIMETRNYAEVQANAHERDAATATTESNRLLLIRIARDLRRWAAGDRAFLESSTSLWQCSISLAVRAKLGFLSVTEDNFEGYIEEVMQHVLPARRSIPPTFLFVTGPNQPELFVTKESAHLAQFASDWIYRQIVSKADLTRLYNRVAEEYPASAEKPEDKPVAKPGEHATLPETLGVKEEDRKQFQQELLDFVFLGVPSKKFSYSPPERGQKRQNPHAEKNQERDAVPPTVQTRQPNRNDPDLRRRREALLSTARIANIPLGMSDVFALDLDALEARLEKNPRWRSDSIQEVLRATKHASETKEVKN